MNNTSVKPFIIPAALIIALLLIGGAVYINRMPQKTAQEMPTPSVSLNPSTTPFIESTISDEELLRTAVLAKSQIPEEKFKFSVGENLGTLAKGMVQNTDDQGGAQWFAGKVNNTWLVSYIGQGVPNCSDLGTIPYPNSWLSHCLDAQGQTVAR